MGYTSRGLGEHHDRCPVGVRPSLSGQSRLLHTMTKESTQPGNNLCDEFCRWSASPKFCVTARGQDRREVDEVTPTMCGVVLTPESTRDGGLEGSGGSSR